MKGFGKRLGTLAVCMLLVCAMIVTASAASTENCTGCNSHEAAIGTTHYDTLPETIAAAEENATVTLLQSIVLNSSLQISKPITLDLGGRTIAGTPGSSQTVLQFTADSTLRSGTVIAGAGPALQAEGCILTLEKDLALHGGTAAPALLLTATGESRTGAKVSCEIQGVVSQNAIYASAAQNGVCELSICQNAKITAAEAAAIKMDGAAKLDISGGELSASGNTVEVNIPEGKTAELSVTGGKLHSKNGETIAVNPAGTASAPTGFVTGGTFNKVPTAYVPAYCRTDDNGDGTYTVTAQYSISFGANGGTGTMGSVQADRGATITLPKCTYTAPAGKHFKAWLIGGKEYAPGATFAINGDLNLTAVWASHSGGYATCSAKAVCTSCGAAYGDYAVHNLVASGGTAATCTEDGLNSHSRCTACGNYFVSGVSISASSLSIPALGHEMVSVEGKAATCTEDGLLAHEKCTQCGLTQSKGEDITDEQLLIPATGHKLETVAAVASTCTDPGVEAHERCSLCKELFADGKATTADALTTIVGSHVLSDWESDDATHWKSCLSCGEVFRQHSHKDADSSESCDDCGYAMPAAKDAEATAEDEGFSWLFLIPIIAAVVIAVSLVFKKRK